MVNLAAYAALKEELSDKEVQIVAVSKFKTAQDIQELYEKGQRFFGENYVQELVTKYEALPQDIQWQFIGHLQSNKVKYIAPFISMIQSVDSFKLLKEINKHAKANDRVIDVLLQVYVGNEATKYGLDEKETMELLEYYEAQQSSLQHVRIRGLMGMASFVEDMDIVRKEFSDIAQLMAIFKTQFFLSCSTFDILSMGMSSDYQAAVAAGSTMVRVGSTLFGRR